MTGGWHIYIYIMEKQCVYIHLRIAIYVGLFQPIGISMRPSLAKL